jgi:hypothetical protein
MSVRIHKRGKNWQEIERKNCGKKEETGDLSSILL